MDSSNSNNATDSVPTTAHQGVGLSATYSPEDNKLRLYSVSRLPRDLYDRVKAAGFRWARAEAVCGADVDAAACRFADGTVR